MGPTMIVKSFGRLLLFISFLYLSPSPKPYVKQMVSLYPSEYPFEPFCYIPLNRGTGVVFSKSRLRFFERKNELQLNCTSFRTTGLSGIVVKKKSIFCLSHRNF